MERVLYTGVVAEVYGHGPGSGLATVTVKGADGGEFAVHGDWRAMKAIADDLTGEEVEVVDRDGVEFVRPL